MTGAVEVEDFRALIETNVIGQFAIGIPCPGKRPPVSRPRRRHRAGEGHHLYEPPEHWSGQLPERVPLGGHALHFAVIALREDAAARPDG